MAGTYKVNLLWITAWLSKIIWLADVTLEELSSWVGVAVDGGVRGLSRPLSSARRGAVSLVPCSPVHRLSAVCVNRHSGQTPCFLPEDTSKVTPLSVSSAASPSTWTGNMEGISTHLRQLRFCPS